MDKWGRGHMEHPSPVVVMTALLALLPLDP